MRDPHDHPSTLSPSSSFRLLLHINEGEREERGERERREGREGGDGGERRAGGKGEHTWITLFKERRVGATN